MGREGKIQSKDTIKAALLGLGLLVLLGLWIRKSRQVPPPQNQSMTGQAPTLPSANVTMLQEIRRETRFGTSLALWGIALALLIYSVGLILPTNAPHTAQGIAGILVAASMFPLGFERVRRWLETHRIGNGRIQIAITTFAIVLIGLSILFALKII